MNQFLAFLMTFWPLKMYCSLRSQCWMRLFLWFSTSMDFFYRKWIMILHEEVWVWSSKKLNGQRHICWSKRPHPKIPVSTNVSLSTPWLPQLIFMSLEVRSRRHLFIITTTAPQTMSHCCSCDIIQYFFIKAYLKAYFRHIVFSGFFARILLVSLILDEHPMQTFLFCCVIYPWYWRFLRKKNPRIEKKKILSKFFFKFWG